jgi:hypothetical protein
MVDKGGTAMKPHANVDRILAEMEETERRYEELAYAEWRRMREARRVPIGLKPIQSLIVAILALGLAGYILSELLFGWHF